MVWLYLSLSSGPMRRLIIWTIIVLMVAQNGAAEPIKRYHIDDENSFWPYYSTERSSDG